LPLLAVIAVGTSCASDSPPIEPGPARLVFVTSAQGNGNLATWPDAGSQTGVAAADAICRARAAAAALANPERFVAWISDGVVGAATRLPHNNPWQRIDGVQIAANRNDLTDGVLGAPIAIDETGAAASRMVWTGTGWLGSAGAAHCNGWTDGSASQHAISGDSQYTDPRWTITPSGAQPCDAVFALYCFET
jgi:hypothetical protein